MLGSFLVALLLHPVRTVRYVVWCVQVVSEELSRVAHDHDQAAAWRSGNE